MTLAEMDTYLQLLLAETSTSSDFGSTAQRYDMINEGILVFQMETKIVRPATPYASITLATGTRGYNLPTDFLSVAEGVFLYNASGVYQKEIDFQEGGYREFILNNMGNGEPANYCVFGTSKASDTAAPVQQIQFDPPPAVAYNNFIVRVYYAKQPLVLDGTTEISDIPVQFHRGPVCIAVAIFKERDQEFDQAKYFWSKADYWMKRAKREFYGWDKSITAWRYKEGQYVSR